MEKYMSNEKLLKLISDTYEGNIELLEPLNNIPTDTPFIPVQLKSILKSSNGIQETIYNPNTNERESIGWIIQPLQLIIEDTQFYHEEYGIEGTVFSTDGAGNPFYIKTDQKIYFYECIDGEEVCKANSLFDFFLINKGAL